MIVSGRHGSDFEPLLRTQLLLTVQDRRSLANSSRLDGDDIDYSIHTVSRASERLDFNEILPSFVNMVLFL